MPGHDAFFLVNCMPALSLLGRSFARRCLDVGLGRLPPVRNFREFRASCRDEMTPDRGGRGPFVSRRLSSLVRVVSTPFRIPPSSGSPAPVHRGRLLH